MRFRHGANLGVHALFLLEQHPARLEVADLGHHAALHDGATFVIFDVAHPARFREGDLLCEALLLEVADRVVVGVGEEVHDVACSFHVVFQVGHEVCAVTLDLLVRRDGAEDDFGELAAFEGTVGYPAAIFVNVDSNGLSLAT